MFGMDAVLGAAQIGTDIYSARKAAQSIRETNEMNYKISKENRDWQGEMSNTAYQRSAKDLEAAGLNRVLALGSPSSTPAPSMATMEAPYKGVDYGRSFERVMAVNSARAQLDKISEETKLLREQQGKTAAEKAQVEALTGMIPSQQQEIMERILNIGSQTGLYKQQERVTAANAAQAEVLKGIYEAVGPEAEKLFREVPGLIQSAKQAVSGFDEWMKKFTSGEGKEGSAKGVQEYLRSFGWFRDLLKRTGRE